VPCARVVEGLIIIDRGDADDKIIAVLEGDYIWDEAQELTDLPPALLECIEHYFSTYKLVPGEPPRISVTGRYGFEAAGQVIHAAIDDYLEMFAQLR
jgi:inorganic pyrophosphatase